jgi:hypothetical protein
VTALVAVETVVLVLLTVVVTGLLRSHGEILRRLHAMGAGLDPDADPDQQPAVLRPRGDLPRAREGLGPAADVAGLGLHDDAVAIPVVGVQHRTLLAFLSSGCLTCRNFWDALAEPRNLQLPPDVRVVVVTKDAAEESLSSLRDLAAPDLAVVMSSDTWANYTVPGSPYFALVDGPLGRVVGEGTGQSWPQVQNLIAHASGDEHEVRRPLNGAAATEARIDRELLVHGIMPGDPRLYGSADELDRTR